MAVQTELMAGINLNCLFVLPSASLSLWFSSRGSSHSLINFLCRCGDPLFGAPTLTQARHRAHLQRCAAALAQYQRYRDTDLALAAEGVRLAVTSLGRITGRVGAEEILDIIFKDFCIGK